MPLYELSRSSSSPVPDLFRCFNNIEQLLMTHGSSVVAFASYTVKVFKYFIKPVFNTSKAPVSFLHGEELSWPRSSFAQLPGIGFRLAAVEVIYVCSSLIK
jgi:hypothetical protein